MVFEDRLGRVGDSLYAPFHPIARRSSGKLDYIFGMAKVQRLRRRAFDLFPNVLGVDYGVEAILPIVAGLSGNRSIVASEKATPPQILIVPLSLARRTNLLSPLSVDCFGCLFPGEV